jgi:hypothetical protein
VSASEFGGGCGGRGVAVAGLSGLTENGGVGKSWTDLVAMGFSLLRSEVYDDGLFFYYELGLVEKREFFFFFQ